MKFSDFNAISYIWALSDWNLGEEGTSSFGEMSRKDWDFGGFEWALIFQAAGRSLVPVSASSSQISFSAAHSDSRQRSYQIHPLRSPYYVPRTHFARSFLRHNFTPRSRCAGLYELVNPSVLWTDYLVHMILKFHEFRKFHEFQNSTVLPINFFRQSFCRRECS